MIFIKALVFFEQIFNLELNLKKNDKFTSQRNKMNKKQKIVFLSLVIISILFISFKAPDNLSIEGYRTIYLTLILAILWMTETISITVTALLPIILIPILGIGNIKQATAPYANELVFLFMAGFFIAAAIEKWKLHKRFAFMIINRIGYSKKKLLLGFMLVTSFLSMWISNTATVLIMLPMAISVLSEIKKIDEYEIKFDIALLLGIAYSASIGGIATLIGTPPNAFSAAFLNENYKINISFTGWMIYGVTFSVFAFVALFIILSTMYLKKGNEKEIIKSDINLFEVQKITSDELKVLIVFALVAVGWIFQPFLEKIYSGINDTSIAMFGAVLLFIIPSSDSKNTLLTWKDAEKISWGILILFGGGLSLANSIQSSGLADWISRIFMSINFIPSYWLILIITFSIMMLTELTSNLATTATFIPIVASIAQAMNENILLFVIPATIGASCAFMLPVGTPPNAIVFSSNRLKIPDMIRTGINMIFASLLIVMTIIYFLLKHF